MKAEQYIVRKNPRDAKFYVLGHIGRNQYMVVSGPFNLKSKALDHRDGQIKADRNARGIVGDSLKLATQLD